MFDVIEGVYGYLSKNTIDVALLCIYHNAIYEASVNQNAPRIAKKNLVEKIKKSNLCCLPDNYLLCR